jgi:hypothetical protein
MQTFTNDVSGSNRTLRDTFESRREQYASIQRRLAKRMAERAAEFASGQQGWAFVADERRILEYLALALAAAGDRSAVDELKIPY